MKNLSFYALTNLISKPIFCETKRKKSDKKGVCRNIFVILHSETNAKTMGRIMAIDYGRKRTGLAVSDTARIIATPLATVETYKLMPFIDDYLKREPVDTFVVGLAKQMDNTPSESSRYIEPFVKTLATRYPTIPVRRVDERFTSKMAFQSMIDGGLGRKRRQDKGLIDTVSAVIILQSFMQSESIEKERGSNSSTNQCNQP